MKHFSWAAAAVLAVSAMAPASAAPTFNLTYVAGTGAQAQAGFQTAANFWASKLSDAVTLDMTVGTGALGAGILAQAGSVQTPYGYSTARAALAANATSAVDASAVSGLPGGSSFSTYVNYTSDNPNGAGSPTPYVDSSGPNNTNIRMTNANAKALGLAPVGGNLGGACAANCDAFIQFATSFTYDFDASNGITAGAFDFVGLAIHEIGHALGFISGVDVLDGNSPNGSTFFPANAFTFVTPLDMYRCSLASAAAGADIDFTANSTNKIFSFDDCATSLGTFSTGIAHGDGRQASHWKDNLSLGIMDPTAASGQILVVTALDLIGFDSIGWELTVVPEIGALALSGVWLSGMLAARRRRIAA